MSFRKISSTAIHLSGSALFYALLVALLIAAFSTAMITGAYYHRVLTDFADLELQLVQNATSGLEFLKAEKQPFQRQAIDLFGAQEDSVLLEKKTWGLFEIAISEAFQQTSKGRLSHQKIAMLGSPPAEDWEKAAIYLRDGFKPLTLAGQTRIVGDAFLPKSGVKGGYVDGQSYSGEELIFGEKKNSTAQLPAIDESMIEHQFKQFGQRATHNFYALPDSLEQSFFAPTISVRDSLIYIDQQLLKGNICLVADSLVYIGRNTVVEDILIYAPAIYIEEGFKGNLQAFATHYLEVSRQAELTYPSVVALLQPDTVKQSSLGYFRGEAKLEGLFLVLDAKKGNPVPIVRVEKGSHVEGQIFTNTSRLDFQGILHGNLTTSGLRLRTTTSQYENHLWNVTIDAAQRPDFYLSPLLFNNPQKEIVKRMKTPQ